MLSDQVSAAIPTLKSVEHLHEQLPLTGFETSTKPTAHFTVALVELKPTFGVVDKATYKLNVAFAAVQKRLRMLAGHHDEAAPGDGADPESN